MSENENIEARLCSYVEGDLDAEGRAEIEKYLLVNPRYRPLIEELSRTRGLLRDLPRDSAPAELLETLSGQIERSALLGDGDNPAGRIHSNRMPQLAAWAAVLVLTAGLAAVVYRVLPANKAQPEVALLKEAPRPVIATQSSGGDLQKPSELDVSAVPAPATDQVAQGVPHEAVAVPTTNADQIAIAKADAPLAAPMAPTTAPSAHASAAIVMDGSVAGNNAVTNVATGAATDERSRDFVVGGDATQLGQNMYVTVKAADPKLANGRITTYLNDNRIPFESRLDASNLSNSAELQRKMPTSLFFSTGTPINSQPGTQFAMQRASVAHAASAGFDPARVQSIPTTQAAAVTAYPTTEDQTSVSDSTGNVIIARNLSPQQVKKLTSDLAIDVTPSVQGTQQSVQSQNAQQADDQAADGLLQSGQTIRIVARDNGLPGVEAMNEQQAIDGDGNITLPLVGKVRASGLTAAELAQSIPIAYRDAKSPTTATWAIDRVIDRSATTAPTTGPAVSLTSAITSAIPTTAPALQATTRPAIAAADKDRSLGAAAMGETSSQTGIDVTIRVIAPAVAATMPTTQAVPGSSNEIAPAAALPITAAPTIQLPATMPSTIPFP